MSVRGKMRLIEMTDSAWSAGKTLVFRAQYDNSIPEDIRYATATPNAEFKMQVDNPAALDQFKLGGYYYVDFTEAPAP